MRGFTLIELLLVIGIFLVVGIAVTPLFGNLTVTTQLNEETSQLVQTMRIARERAVAGFHNARHGVCWQISAGGSEYVLYEGASCATRIIANDRVTTLPPVLQFTTTFNDNDLNFNSVGAPAAAGTITVTHTTYGARTISINELGLVEE